MILDSKHPATTDYKQSGWSRHKISRL